MRRDQETICKTLQPHPQQEKKIPGKWNESKLIYMLYKKGDKADIKNYLSSVPCIQDLQKDNSKKNK